MGAEHTHVAVVIGPDGEARVLLAFADLRAGVWIGSGEDCAIRIPDVAARAAVVFEWSTRIFARRGATEVPRTPREGDDDVGGKPARFGASMVAIQRYSATQVVLSVDGEDHELGEFHDVWREPVTIGSAAGNRVVLAGLRAHAATLTARSNHRFLEVAGEPVRRVDHGDFQLGPYTLRIDED